MSSPVEIEFAVNFSSDSTKPHEFYLLQMRPMVIDQELERLRVLETHPEDAVVRSTSVLGNGVIEGVHDVVVVDVDRYDRADSTVVSREVASINQAMLDRKAPYLLIGVGRWGSADPWLGIPVRWEDISGASVIVEAAMKDIKVTPSQGTHFFQNITAARIGYLTVDSPGERAFVAWDWLRAQPAEREESYARHLHFEEPLTVYMDGHRGEAVILKPGVALGDDA